MLCDKQAPLRKRGLYLNAIILPTLLWCAGWWYVTRDQVQHVGQIQRDMFQIMVGMRLRDPETVDDFCVRRNKKKRKHQREELSPSPWDGMVYKSVYTWAGLVSRLSLYDSNRLTHHALMHTSYRHILLESKWTPRTLGKT